LNDFGLCDKDFSFVVVCILSGVPITFSDLEFMDKQLHTNLKWLRENKEVDTLCLDFTVRRDTFVGIGADSEKGSADNGAELRGGRGWLVFPVISKLFFGGIPPPTQSTACNFLCWQISLSSNLVELASP
jgi:hypothetical protein